MEKITSIIIRSTRVHNKQYEKYVQIVNSCTSRTQMTPIRVRLSNPRGRVGQGKISHE